MDGFNSLHKQDRLVRTVTHPPVYKGQMRSMSDCFKLLLLQGMPVAGTRTANIHIHLYIYQEIALYCLPIRIYHTPEAPHLRSGPNPAHCQQRKVYLKHERF